MMPLGSFCNVPSGSMPCSQRRSRANADVVNLPAIIILSCWVMQTIAKLCRRRGFCNNTLGILHVCPSSCKELPMSAHQFCHVGAWFIFGVSVSMFPGPSCRVVRGFAKAAQLQNCYACRCMAGYSSSVVEPPMGPQERRCRGKLISDNCSANLRKGM